MRRRADPSKGVILCFFLNLLLHAEWLILALILLGLHYWFGIPVFLFRIALAVWLFVAIFMTALTEWSNRVSSERSPRRANKNPYSAKTSDLFPGPAKPSDSAPDTEEAVSAPTEQIPDSE